ncbi:polysaccharide deacetylase family protein [Pseudoxanthobacter sp. M-2]|uniref:polysaccharide deacetylase family protein n=1 Tax=Pseudoxanthobacter sp. M-2 TaxID=3078754 RepID=UPI0038FC8B34
MLRTHGRYDYSPITDRPDYVWPNGARLALYVGLGIEDYAFGEGMVEDIAPGTPQPDFLNTAWRDYGNRVGAFRLIDRLTQHSIAPTVLLNTEVYETAPALIEAARRAGAEFVAHGLSNSDTLTGMSEGDERAYIDAVAAAIAKAEGAPPRGWSSPWLAYTENTFDLLAEAGYGYVLGLRLDDQPVWLKTRSRPLLAVPYAVELNDSSTIIGRQADARDFAEAIIDEFEEMLAAAEERPLVMSLVVHSFISGQPFRLRALTRALEHIAARRDRVWFARAGDIARFIEADPARAV